MTILEVKHLTTGYGGRKIIHNLSFLTKEGELVGILGANGSGKTTLLKALCGILPSQGTRRILGADLGSLNARQISRLSRYIPQRSGISIDLSALDVVLMGFNPNLGLLELPTKQMQSAARQALEQVGLGERADTNYQTLSEGQKQLVILARTLLLEEGVLFLDEPESALDFGGRYRILELVRNWLNAPRRSALVTLHDPQLALNSCDRLLLVKDSGLLAQIVPSRDSLAEMEEKMSLLYGPLSIHRCESRSGIPQLVLLKE